MINQCYQSSDNAVIVVHVSLCVLHAPVLILTNDALSSYVLAKNGFAGMPSGYYRKEITKYLFIRDNVNIYSLVRSRGAFAFSIMITNLNCKAMNGKLFIEIMLRERLYHGCACIFTFKPYNVLKTQTEKVSGSHIYRLFMVVGK